MLVMKNISFTKTQADLLNMTIDEFGDLFGPSLTYLIMHGPISKEILHPENLKILETRKRNFWEQYKQEVIPHLGPLINSMCQWKSKNLIFPEKKDFSKGFPLEKKSLRTVRETSRGMYERLGGFTIDNVTARGLYSERELPKNDYIRYFIRKRDGFVISIRPKLISSIEARIEREYQNLAKKPDLLNQFPDFILENSMTPFHFWTNVVYDSFCEKYGGCESPLLKMSLADIVGVRITDFNLERAKENQERFIGKSSELDFSPFEMTGVSIDDYRQPEESHNGQFRTRKELERPGGVHVTFSKNNFPFELQLKDSQDMFFSMFGPNSDGIYLTRGKKTNSKYN
jgi:hypothetical protein